FLARLAAAGTGIPVLYTPNCFAFHDGVPRLQATIIAALERLAARYLTSYIMTVCEDERQLALRYRVGRPEQLITVYTGIDPRPFDREVDRAALRASLGIPAMAPLAGVVGRLNLQKAPLDFIMAAAQLHARRPDIHFVWVGSGPLAEEARAQVAALGL